MYISRVLDRHQTHIPTQVVTKLWPIFNICKFRPTGQSLGARWIPKYKSISKKFRVLILYINAIFQY